MTTTIALIGAPGSGKSTVGQLLARRLGVEFRDVDAEIAEAQDTTVAQIFLDHGEEHFRRLEHDATLAALAEPGVVALGGGAPVQADIATALGGVTTVWLDVSARTASSRVGLNDATRPLLLGNVHSQLVKLMAQRRPVYAGCATVQVVTDDKTPEQVVEEVLGLLDDADPRRDHRDDA